MVKILHLLTLDNIFQYIILCDSAFFQSVLQVLCYGSDGNPIGRCIGKREEIIKNLNSCIYICEKAINEGERVLHNGI